VISGTAQRQPLTGVFKGREHLGAYGGHGSTSIGAICDPAAFTGVVIVGPGRLGPRDGFVVIDLVEPGSEPQPLHDDQVIRQVFPRAGRPSVVITVGRNYRRPNTAGRRVALKPFPQRLFQNISRDRVALDVPMAEPRSGARGDDDQGDPLTPIACSSVARRVNHARHGTETHSRSDVQRLRDGMGVPLVAQ